jgi:hypothetical protein
MIMNRYFQHAHLLTTRTVIYKPPDVLTLKLPSFVCVFEAFQSALKTKMANLLVMYFTNGIVLLTSQFEFFNYIGRHDGFRSVFRRKINHVVATESRHRISYIIVNTRYELNLK